MNVEKWTAEKFAKWVAQLSSDLTRLATDIQRTAERRQDGEPYTQVAQAIQHDVLWGLANLGLDRLTGLAAAADCAVIEAGQAQVTEPYNTLTLPATPFKAAETWDVVLQSANDRKIATIKAIRSIFPMELTAARDLLYRLPQTILIGVPKDQAAQAVKELKAAGASAELHPTGTQAVPFADHAVIEAFDVVLREVPNKLQAIRAIRSFIDLGLKPAKTMVDFLPSTVLVGVSPERAQRAVKELQAVGVTVELRPATSGDLSPIDSHYQQAPIADGTLEADGVDGLIFKGILRKTRDE